MRWFLLGALIFLNFACATLANRRDLYRPNQGGEESISQNGSAVRATKTSTRTTRTPATPVTTPPPGSIAPDEETVLPPP